MGMEYGPVRGVWFRRARLLVFLLPFGLPLTVAVVGDAAWIMALLAIDRLRGKA